jgi:putative protein-disulfide isomerase
MTENQEKPASKMATLYFYHDPMCSWCWGYRPVSDQVLSNLPHSLRLVKIVGGLAPDSDEPMPDSLLEGLPKAWSRIHELLGTEFNFDFWTKCKPRRSTYAACRAVLAAGKQDRYDEMIDAIQRAYYLRAMNPSDLDTLELLSSELGLDAKKFADQIRSAEIEDELQQQINFSRQSPIDGFPSLVIEIDGQLITVKRDYKDPQPTLDHIDQLISGSQTVS